MTHFHPAALAHRRQRFTRPDAQRYLRPDWQRFMRPDVQRYLLPGYGVQDVYGLPADDTHSVPAGQNSRDALDPAALEAERRSLHSEALRIRADIAALKFRATVARFALLCGKAYNPNQPRVPAGDPAGGQWTRIGTSLVHAGLPKIPKRPPPTTKERNVIIKAVAIALAEAGLAASDYVKRSSWLYYAYPYISAYLDGPKSLAELHELAKTPAKGYDIHHIVEQTSAERFGFSRKIIDRDDNLVRIPTLKHWEINAWFQTPNRAYDDLSPREYLRYKSWDERRRVGLYALRKFGVLK
jgi:hypothetical protein